MAERIASDFKYGVEQICFGYRLSLINPLDSWMKIEHYSITVTYSDAGFEDLEEYN